MTQEQQDKLRRALYNAKFTTDAYDENPFVGIYFQDLLGIIADYDNKSHWIPVDKELPEKEKDNPSLSVNVIVTDGSSTFESYYSFNTHIWAGAEIYGTITHWMPMPTPPQENEE
jgi:hypothetical protein